MGFKNKYVLFCGAIVTIAIASLGLISYLPGLSFWGRLGPDYIPMAPSTSISFIFLVFLPLLAKSKFSNKSTLSIAVLFVAIVTLFGLLEVIGNFTNSDLNFENVLVPNVGTLNGVPVARMSPITGGVFFISGIALLLLTIPPNRRLNYMGNCAGFLSVIIFGGGITVIFGYLYGTPFLYDQQTIPMAFTTALAFFSFSIVLFAGISVTSFPINLFHGFSTQAKLMRTFLPVIVFAVLMQALAFPLQRTFLSINNALYSAITLVVVIFITVLVVSKSARFIGGQIDSSEQKRKMAEEKLVKHRNHLEALVEERTSELQEINKELLFQNDEKEKRTAELIAANTALDQFAYITSHDLQEPLRTILNYIQVFEEDYLDQLDNNAKKYLLVVQNAAKRMSVLIKSLLDYSRLGRNFKLSQVDCKKMVGDVIADLDTIIKNSSAVIEVRNMPTLNLCETEIRRIFQNLIVNAIKFQKKGSPPKIKICSVKIKDQWKFSVADNGIGIAAAHLEKIFDIFQRIHATEKEYEGEGLGLSNCKKIVQMHHGKIWVESDLGKGATFYFTLPEITL